MQAPCSPFPSLFGPEIAIYQLLIQIWKLFGSPHAKFQPNPLGELGHFAKSVFAFKKKSPQTAEISPKLTLEGLKYPPVVDFNIKNVLLHAGHLYKPLGGVREGQNDAKNAPRTKIEMPKKMGASLSHKMKMS